MLDKHEIFLTVDESNLNLRDVLGFLTVFLWVKGSLLQKNELN